MLLQPPLNTHKIDAKYPKGYRPAKKEDKKSKKNKSTDSPSVNVPNRKQLFSTYQTSFVYLKKDQNHQNSP